MSRNKDEIIEGAIAGGLIGAALGALLTGKSKGALASAIAGAAIGASLKALNEAKNIDRPVLYEKDGEVYKIYPDGRREFVKKLEQNQTEIPSTFTLD